MNLKSELQNAKQEFVTELCKIEKKLNDEKGKLGISGSLKRQVKMSYGKY